MKKTRGLRLPETSKHRTLGMDTGQGLRMDDGLGSYSVTGLHFDQLRPPQRKMMNEPRPQRHVGLGCWDSAENSQICIEVEPAQMDGWCNFHREHLRCRPNQINPQSFQRKYVFSSCPCPMLSLSLLYAVSQPVIEGLSSLGTEDPACSVVVVVGVEVLLVLVAADVLLAQAVVVLGFSVRTVG